MNIILKANVLISGAPHSVGEVVSVSTNLGNELIGSGQAVSADPVVTTEQMFGVDIPASIARDAEVAAAAATKVNLTDYQNVVVVDAGGNGDYTALSAAVAANAFAGASTSKRYLVELFGEITEPVSFTMPDFVDLVGVSNAAVKVADSQYITFGTQTSYTVGLPPISIFNVRFSAVSSATTTGIIANNDEIIFEHCKFQCAVRNQSGGLSGVDFRDCRFVTGALIIDDGAISNFYSCKLGMVLAPNSGAVSATLVFRDCYIKNSITVNDTWILYDTVVEKATDYAITINSGSLTIDNTVVRSLGGTSKWGIKLTAGSLYIRNSYIASLGTSGIGLSIVLTGIVAMHALNAVFEAANGSNKAVSVDSAYNSAPFYQCTFKGGVTNLTAAAGTANGTNVSF